MNDSPRETRPSPGVDRVTLELNTERSEELEVPTHATLEDQYRRINTEGGEPRSAKHNSKTPKPTLLGKFTFPDEEETNHNHHHDDAITPLSGFSGFDTNVQIPALPTKIVQGGDSPFQGPPMLMRGDHIKAAELKIDLGYSEDDDEEAEDSDEEPDMMPALSLTKAKSSYPNMGKLRRATGTKPIGLLEHRASEPVQSLAALVKEVSKEMPLVKIVWKKTDNITAGSVDQYTTLSDVFRQVANAKSTRRFPSPRTVSNSAPAMSLLATNEPMEAIVYPPEVRDYSYYHQVFAGVSKCYVAADKKPVMEQQELFDYIYKLGTSQLQSSDEYNRKKQELLAKLKSNIETGHGAKSAVLKSTALAFASLLEAKKQKMSSSLVAPKDGDQENLGGRSSTVVTDEGPQFKDYIPVIDNLANTGCSNLVNVMDKSSALSKDGLGASIVRIGTVELPGLLPLLNSFTKNPLRFASKHPGELIIKPSNLEQNENIKKLLEEEIGKCFGSSIPVLRSPASLELIRIKRETSRDQMSNFSILGRPRGNQREGEL